MPETKQEPDRVETINSEAVDYDTHAAIVIGAHGIQGTLKVKPVTPTAVQLFAPDNRSGKGIAVWLGPDRSEGQIVNIVSVKRQEPKEVYLVHVKGIADRTSAEQLIGKSLYGKSGERAPLSEDEYFVEDLIGMEIVDRNGEKLGTLEIVHSGVANDVYETSTGVLIPAVRAFIDSVDLAARKIVVIDASALSIN